MRMPGRENPENKDPRNEDDPRLMLGDVEALDPGIHHQSVINRQQNGPELWVLNPGAFAG